MDTSFREEQWTLWTVLIKWTRVEMKSSQLHKIISLPLSYYWVLIYNCTQNAWLPSGLKLYQVCHLHTFYFICILHIKVLFNIIYVGRCYYLCKKYFYHFIIPLKMVFIYNILSLASGLNVFFKNFKKPPRQNILLILLCTTILMAR